MLATVASLLASTASSSTSSAAGAGGGASAGRLAWAVVVTAVACIPLAISAWAFLDAAHRPQWAWALAGRRQVVWMAVILFGTFTVIGGLAVSGWYLLRVRPVIAGAERGELPDPPRSQGH